MGALLSLALSALGGWPLALIRGLWSALLDAARTPLGAAAIAGCVAWMIGHHAGWSESEAVHARAAAEARLAAEIRTKADRETARADGERLAASAAEREVRLQEIVHDPLPRPRPGGDCTLDTRRLR